MVEDYEVAVLEVEAVQLIAGALCVHDIFEDDEGGAFGVVGYALANRIAPKRPKRSNSSSGVT